MFAKKRERSVGGGETWKKLGGEKKRKRRTELTRMTSGRKLIKGRRGCY